MYQKKITRPLPKKCKILAQTIKGKEVKVAQFRRNGVLVTRQLSKCGTRILDNTDCYYHKIKMPNGEPKEVNLGKTKHDAEAKLRQLEVNNDLIRRGLAPANYEGTIDLESLLKERIANKRRLNRKECSIEQFERNVRIILKDLNLSTVDDLLNPTFQKQLVEYIHKLETTPVHNTKIPDYPEFTINQLSSIFGIQPSPLRHRLKQHGISCKGTISKADAQMIAESRNKPMSKQTIRLNMSYFKDFLLWLKKKEIIPNVIKFPEIAIDKKDKRNHRRVILWEECQALSQAVLEENRNYERYTAKLRSFIYKFAFMSLLRRRALSSIKCKDLIIDGLPFNGDPKQLEGKISKIQVSILAEYDKTGTARCILVHPLLIKDLLDIIRNKKPNDLILTDLETYPIYGALCNDLKLINQNYKTADGKIDMHSFRHSGATHFIRNGVSVPKVAQWGGWTNWSTLEKIYAHIRSDDVYDDFNRIF